MTGHSVKSTHLQTGRFVSLCSCGAKCKGVTRAAAYDSFLHHCSDVHLEDSYEEDHPELDLGTEP